MPYDPHVLVTFGGKLSEAVGFDEIWQCGVRCSYEPGSFDEHNYVAEVADNLAAWFTDTDSWHSDTTTLEFLKAALIAADGNYPSDSYAPAEALYASPPHGAHLAVAAPSYCSVVYSWRSTDHARGPGSHGRIYPPNFAMPVVAGTARITDANAALLAGQAVQLLTALQNAGGADIVSPGIFSNIGPTSSVITSVKVGNIMDRQARRRNAVKETYQALPFP